MTQWRFSARCGRSGTAIRFNDAALVPPRLEHRHRLASWKAGVLTHLDNIGASLELSAVSQITRIEVLAFASLPEQDEKEARKLFDSLSVLPISETVEQEAIQIRRAARFKLPDAIIAATAKANGLQLVTLDERLASAFAALT